MFIIVVLFLEAIIAFYGYLIGSIPTGYWLAKYFFNIDVTKNGSGNIGATNVARVLGSKKYFFLIFFLDFLKAFLCLYLFFVLFVGGKIEKEFLYYFQMYLIAFFLLFGNAYSIFLNLKGGKGVSTSLGIVAFFAPIQLFIFFIVCWSIFLFFIKCVGISSLLAIYLTTIYFYIFNYSNNPVLLYFLIFLCFWLTFSHRNNLKLLFNKN